MILLLDNKDSFVWNLAQALQQLGEGVDVVRSDRIAVAAAESYRAIVVSPGPGRPEDAGASVDFIREWSGKRPILGVCLGHQAIAAAFGGSIVRGRPVHGRPTPIHHNGLGLFEGLPQPLSACRYHSLYVAEDLPKVLSATAHSEAGEIMAVQHREHLTYGVQFHPESFRSPDGDRLLQNFLAMVPNGMPPVGISPVGNSPESGSPDGLLPDGLLPDGLPPDGLLPDSLLPDRTPPKTTSSNNEVA
ncbi:MAG: anthranilate synthase/aminodeoxychorismate synthase-like glutamine amidotransferase [Planctomycetota bacterium]